MTKNNKKAKRQPKQKAKVKQQKKSAPRQKKGGSKITKLGSLLRTGGAIAGGFLGNSKLGESLGAGISRIFGQGDYKVASNSLASGGPPAFASLDTGIRFSHREYITDITSSTSFANTTYQITPTNAALFPWLSKIAYNFEEYCIKGIVFYFNTTCGSAISSTNNALGTVGMTTVYDPTDPDLGNKRECEDYGGCVAGVPSASLIHPVECKPRSNVLPRLYVMISSITNPEDWKFYSHGKLNVFTQGMQQAGVVLGELWVSYDIEFYNPKILPVGAVGAAASKISATTSTSTASQIFGTSDLPQTKGNLGASYSGSTGDIIIPAGTAAGYYYVNYMGSAGSGAWTITTSAVTSNVVITNYFQGDSSGHINAPNSATANAWHGAAMFIYKSDTNACRFKFTNAVGTITAPWQFDLTICKVPGTIAGGLDIGLSSYDHKKQTEFEVLVSKLKQALGLPDTQEDYIQMR